MEHRFQRGTLCAPRVPNPQKKKKIIFDLCGTLATLFFVVKNITFFYGFGMGRHESLASLGAEQQRSEVLAKGVRQSSSKG